MIVQCFLSVFLFVLYYLPMCYSGTEPTPTSGPFKSSVVSFSDCRNPGRPYSKKPLITFDPLIQNIDGRTMLGGNLTVFKDIKDVKFKIKRYTWHDGKWQQPQGFNNLDCHSALLHITYLALRVKYDKTSCISIKGFYSFKNIDVNQLQHIWVSTMPYGRLLWRSEAFNNGVTLFCKEFDTVTVPV